MSLSKRQPGFTLIELIVVLMIISVMLAVAAPRLAGRSQAATLRAAANDVQALATAARAKAVLQSQSVGLLLTADGQELRLVIAQQTGSQDQGESTLSNLTPARRLPQGIQARFVPDADSDPELIKFQPDGSADGGVLHIEDDQDGKLLLQLSQPLGQLRLADSP